MDTVVGPRPWFFDAWAWIYDAPWVQRRVYWPVHDAVVAALDPAARAILDLGCGTGQLSARLAACLPAAAVVGCDFSAGMLHQAARRCAGLALVQGDAGALPFADRAFDAIVCTEAFHWFPDPAVALAECFRVLRPGGRLLLAVTTTPAPAVSRLIQAGSRLVGEPFYWPSRAEARHWLQRAGFDIDCQHGVARLGAPLLAPIVTVAARPRRQASRRRPARRRRATPPRRSSGSSAAARDNAREAPHKDR